MKNLYYRLKTIKQFAISITICLKLVCFVLKEFKDVIDRMTRLERLCAGMYGEVYASLFGIIGQGSIEDGLKVGREGSC
jgi:hypothetical protein